MIVVSLSDNELKVLQGTPGFPASADGLLCLNSLMGTVRDGVIVDPAGFQEVVGAFWKSNGLPTSDVKLLLQTSHFANRTLDIPVFKKQHEIDAYIQRELAGMERFSNPVFTYRVLESGSNGMQKIAVVAIDEALIDRVNSCFEQMGIELSGITGPYDAILTMMDETQRRLPEETGTSLMVHVGNEKLICGLFANGQYRYSTEQQLFNEYGTAGFANEVARTVMKVQQFASAQQYSQTLNRVLLVGFTPEAAEICIQAIDESGCAEAVSELPQASILQPNPIHPGNLLSSQMALISTLAIGNSNKSIIRSVKGGSVTSTKGGKSNPVVRAFIPPAICLIICALLLAGTAALNASTSSKLKSTEAQIATPVVQQELQDYVDAIADSEAANAQLNSAVRLKEGLETFPLPDQSVENVVQKCAKGLVTSKPFSYDASTGSYIITAKSDDPEKINKFVRRLIDNGSFEVNYTGYAYQSQEKGGDWELNVTLVLPERKGE